MKFQQYRNIRCSDDFSIICRHQYSIFQMHMSKLWRGDFITLLYCTYHIKAQRSTMRDSQIYSPRATRMWFFQENYVITLTFFGVTLYTRLNCSPFCNLLICIWKIKYWWRQNILKSSRKKFLRRKNTQTAARSKNVVFLRFTRKNIRNARSWKSNRKKPQEVENLTARSHKNLWILPQAARRRKKLL